MTKNNKTITRGMEKCFEMLVEFVETMGQLVRQPFAIWTREPHPRKLEAVSGE